MPGILEPTHARTGLGNKHVSDQGGDARDRGQKLPRGQKRLHRLIDPLGELVDPATQLVDAFQMHLADECMMLAESPGQRFDQLGDGSAEGLVDTSTA